MRARLVDEAARLLGEQGPAGLSSRRLANAAGTSTMAVYTHFGGMPALVRAVVAEGFQRLQDTLAALPVTEDPLADLHAAGLAYHARALADPHLYAVMFGSASLGDYRLHDDELEVGLAAFSQIVDIARRAVDAGLLVADPVALAGQMWLALHGYVMAELAGFHAVVADPEAEILWPMLTHVVAAYAVE